MITGTKHKMKPPVGARPIVGHPLTDGLVGCWLANEGSGSRAFDISGYGNDAIFEGSAGWRTSQLGWAMDLQGSYNSANTAFDGTQYNELSISAWVLPDLTTGRRYIVDNSPGSTGFALRSQGTTLEFFCFSEGSYGFISKADSFSVGQPSHIVAVHNSKNIIYGDGVLLGETNSALGIDSSIERMQIGANYDGASSGWNGAITVLQIWNRSLSPGEIAWLYREPFAMFGGRPKLGFVFSLMPGVIYVTGSAAAESSATAELSVADELPGVLSQRMWLGDALFAGMTANAFKLGTTLSSGWFWMRTGGCSALYRGSEMSCIDFENVLSVANLDAGFVSPPDYVEHSSNSTCFYVVRRFNQCGIVERTLAAAVKLSFDANGDLTEPQPNNIFSSTAKPIEGDKVVLTWFYSTLEQKSAPACFNIYHDQAAGQIDYDNPVATVTYEGRKLYTYKSGSLGAGRYQFAVRAEDADGVVDSSPKPLRIQVSNTNPDAIDVLSVEVV